MSQYVKLFFDFIQKFITFSENLLHEIRKYSTNKYLKSNQLEMTMEIQKTENYDIAFTQKVQLYVQMYIKFWPKAECLDNFKCKCLKMQSKNIFPLQASWWLNT